MSNDVIDENALRQAQIARIEELLDVNCRDDDSPIDVVGAVEELISEKEAMRQHADALRATEDAAVKFLGRIGEATWNAGLPGGDRDQTLKNVTALVAEAARIPGLLAVIDALRTELDVLRAKSASDLEAEICDWAEELLARTRRADKAEAECDRLRAALAAGAEHLLWMSQDNSAHHCAGCGVLCREWRAILAYSKPGPAKGEEPTR